MDRVPRAGNRILKRISVRSLVWVRTKVDRLIHTYQFGSLERLVKVRVQELRTAEVQPKIHIFDYSPVHFRNCFHYRRSLRNRIACSVDRTSRNTSVECNCGIRPLSQVGDKCLVLFFRMSQNSTILKQVWWMTFAEAIWSGGTKWWFMLLLSSKFKVLTHQTAHECTYCSVLYVITWQHKPSNNDNDRADTGVHEMKSYQSLPDSHLHMLLQSRSYFYFHHSQCNRMACNDFLSDQRTIELVFPCRYPLHVVESKNLSPC